MLQTPSSSRANTRPFARRPATITILHIRKFIILCFTAIFVASPLGACLRGGKPGVLVVAIEQPPRGFDPRLSSGNPYSARIMQLIYDSLMTKDEHFDFVPSLAEDFKESPDHTRFTFHLRPGVRFHNGKPLGSMDVKYTFESILDPAFKSPIRGSLDKLASIDTPDSS